MSLSAGRHLAFPFRIGADGRSVTPANDSDHVRDEILQLLLTAPGERPFLTTFGGGVRRLVFEPASEVLKGVTKARITDALSRWLGHRAEVEALEVTFEGELIDIVLKFRPAGSPDSRVLRFQRQGQ
jgi:hypothetical protein